MGNVLSPTEPPLQINSFFNKVDVNFQGDQKSAFGLVAEAEDKNDDIIAMYRQERQGSHILLNTNRQQSAGAVANQAEYARALYVIDNDCDVVRNIRVNAPVGVTRVRVYLQDSETGESQEIETQHIFGVANAPGMSVIFENEAFPLVSLRGYNLVIELVLDPTGLQNMINSQSFLTMECGYMTSRLRQTLISRPVALPITDIVLYQGSIYETYRSYLDRIQQPNTINRVTCMMNNLMFEDQYEGQAGENPQPSQDMDIDQINGNPVDNIESN